MRRYLLNAGFFATTESGRCSFLTIDNLSLSDDITGLSNSSKNGELMIFPNPAQNSIQLDVSGDQLLSFEIIDSFGKSVQRGEFGHDSQPIQVSTFCPGIYLVRAIDKQGNIRIKRFVKV
jgi:hypothetical protein